jgi:hypothetical protein
MSLRISKWQPAAILDFEIVGSPERLEWSSEIFKAISYLPATTYCDGKSVNKIFKTRPVAILDISCLSAIIGSIFSQLICGVATCGNVYFSGCKNDVVYTHIKKWRPAAFLNFEIVKFGPFGQSFKTSRANYRIW